MKKNPNPQGKGLVPILKELGKLLPKDVEAKDIDRISSELFTSLFILEGQINFSPRVGHQYYLYKDKGDYKLSLISNEEWGDSKAYELYIGSCQLHEDLTWSFNISERVKSNTEIMNEIEQKIQRHKNFIEESENLEDIVPGYQEKAKFHQRALIWGLGQSLKASMIKSGLIGLSFEQAKLLEDKKKGP